MKAFQFGPTKLPDGKIQWSLWAPRGRRATLHLLETDRHSGVVSSSTKFPMISTKYGFHLITTEQIPVGQRYGFSIDDGPMRPDPASRWQPDGVHEASAYWDPYQYDWRDQGWRGTSAAELIIYELHIGAFSKKGTLHSVASQLDDLIELGVNAIELMPINQFPGTFGWGYDGVYWYAVHDAYGGPESLQPFVDQCHQRGISVILDVVYNHFGPEGNYFGEFAPIYSDFDQTPWGRAINFDGLHSFAMRDFVVENVLYWIREFHVDGVRLDAVHAIVDESHEHILRSIKNACFLESVRLNRPIHVIAECNLNDVMLLDDPCDRGFGLDKQWNDDFHHCVHAMLTGERNGYYADFHSPEKQFEKALNEVFVYDGVHSHFQNRIHGKPAGKHSGECFVVSIQTHDQVGNRATGDRFGTMLSIEKQRMAAGLLLLSPFTPMLFMGEEYGETRPFPFFCQYADSALKDSVRNGRRREFLDFQWQSQIPDPFETATFESSKLSSRESLVDDQSRLRELYKWLLMFRKRHRNMTDRTLFHANLFSPEQGTNILILSQFRDRTHQDLDWLACFNLSETDWRIDRSRMSPLSSSFRSFVSSTPDVAESNSNWNECSLLDYLPGFAFCVWEYQPAEMESTDPSLAFNVRHRSDQLNVKEVS